LASWNHFKFWLAAANMFEVVKMLSSAFFAAR
jgi:hypothetical protein